MSETISPLRTVAVTRYVTPLREGGSLPALVEADDEFMYVVKFRGAGQGIKALIAELIVGELARFLGLRVPELVFCELDVAFGRSEPDEEIQDLLQASTGQNLGLHYLSGAITYDALVTTIEPRLASQIVWLDALTLNVDRTARNTNMLIWHKELWLIDHGAALYVHHAGPGWAAPRPRPFPQIKDHVLLPQAAELRDVDAEYRAKITAEVLTDILALVPDAWLEEAAAGDATAAEQRTSYVGFLANRLAASETFVQEAQDARKALI
ncbi:HipA family kinase [Hymenobacter cellulosivorans]|uniref:Aminotransferase class I and II n=1 Tax=Hymenobacter cellulosivorans TaxID=2932249 RepID=A0ABY4F241_9BACT|nr:HipA family kinase [Hymenobacter cellulosivorans]UOQ50752.1 aminotransferase class I and II [Hymenobacter cellulosivorans]